MRILRDVRIQFPELTHAASKLEIPGDRWNDEADRLAVQAGLEQSSFKGNLSF